MSTVRITVTAVVEYELNPDHYPEEARDDPQKMLAIDIDGAENDVVLFLYRANTRWLPVTGEVVKP